MRKKTASIKQQSVDVANGYETEVVLLLFRQNEDLNEKQSLPCPNLIFLLSKKHFFMSKIGM